VRVCGDEILQMEDPLNRQGEWRMVIKKKVGSKGSMRGTQQTEVCMEGGCWNGSEALATPYEWARSG